MKMFHLLLVGVLLVGSLGMWGCTHQQTGTINAKIRDLETRYAKLDEDYRVLQTTNEQHKKRLAQSESLRATLELQQADLAKQLQAAAEQGEDLRKQVALRTTERDTAQTSLMQFGKELQALVGRVESALNTPTNNPSLTVVPVSRRTE